jgi:Amt family ammonium transporter
VAAAFLVVFSVSFVVFWVIKKTIGLRVTAEQEEAGLDIVEHGMYGYPEQFIPLPEMGAASSGPLARPSLGETGSPVTAASAGSATSRPEEVTA